MVSRGRRFGLSQTKARLGVLLVAALPIACADENRPNVILISADALARAALPCYEPTAGPLPRLDAFAASAVVFDRAHSPASWTLPSHASVFTGRYPNRHGVVRVQQTMPAEIPMLTERLRDAGYQTLAFTDGAMLDAHFGHARGFQQYDGERLDPELSLRGPLPRDGARPPTSAGHVFDRALAYLAQRRGGDPPFFLFLHSYAVHDYSWFYADRVAPLPEPERMPPYLACELGEVACSDVQWAHLRARYRAGVEHFDAAFGALLDALAGTAEPTIVILFADHGEGFDPQRGRIHHGGRLHADQLRIPLIARLPGVPPRVVAGAASLVDLVPTVLSLLGLPVPAGTDGVDLSGACAGAAAPPRERPVYAMEFAYVWEGGTRIYRPAGAPHALAVIAGDWWLIDGARPELYDMAADPEQRNPLPLDHPAAAALFPLARAAATWTSPESEPALLDEELEEHLRSLGYVQ